MAAASPVRFPPLESGRDADLGVPSRRPYGSPIHGPLGLAGDSGPPANMAFAPAVAPADDELQALRDEVDVLRSHADGVLLENERLHEELRRHAEMIAEARASGLAPGQGGYHPSNAPVTVEEWEELQERLEIATQENDALLEQQHRAEGEIARLREAHRGAVRESYERATEAAAARDETASWRRQTDDLASQMRALAAEKDRLEQEHRQHRLDGDALEEELRRCRMDLQQSAAALNAVKQKLVAANADLQSQTRALEEKDRRVRAADDQVRAAEQAVAEARAECEGLRRTATEAQRERDALRDALAAAKRSIDIAQQKEMSMYNHVQECMDLIEESNLERDQALLREQQATRELQRLSERMRQSLKEAEERSASEIDAARQIAAAECKKLREELARAEHSDAEARALADRAMRDKRTAEKELERVMKEQPAELARIDGIVESLNRRLRAVEAERDRAASELEALRSTAQQQLQHTENERLRLAGQLEDVTRRLRATEKLVEDARSERLDALRNAEETRRALAEAQAAKEDAESRFNARLEALARRHEAAIRDAEVRINEVASKGDAEAAELRGMVTQAQHAVNGWREQARSGRAVVADLQRELDRALREMDELKERLDAANEARLKLKGETDEQARLLRRADVAVAEANAQAEAAAHWAEAQVARMDAQCREEKRQLRRDLRLARIERDRVARERDAIAARAMKLPVGEPSDAYFADFPEDEFALPEDVGIDVGGDTLRTAAKADSRDSSAARPAQQRFQASGAREQYSAGRGVGVQSRGSGFDPAESVSSGEEAGEVHSGSEEEEENSSSER